MASNWDKVKEEVTCGICQDLLNDPKILPCLHSFCTRCLKQWSGSLANLDPSKRDLECPVCRGKVLLSNSRAVEELPSHFTAVRLVEIVRLQEQAGSKKVSPICQNCEEEKAASSCSECAIFLCEFCEKFHQKSKATKGHKICTLDEMRKGQVPSILPEKVEMCPTHPTKPLELYCKCKDVLICRDCIIRRHKDHDYDVIADVVESEKKILKEALPGIQQQIDELEKAVGGVKGRRRDVKDHNVLNLQKLDNEFDIFHAAIDKCKNELREQLSGESKQNDKVLQFQEDELCVLLSQLKSCWSFMDDKLQRGVHKDVLAMKRSMLTRRDQLTDLKKKSNLDPIVQCPLPMRIEGIEHFVESISQLKYQAVQKENTELKQGQQVPVSQMDGSQLVQEFNFNVIKSVDLQDITRLNEILRKKCAELKEKCEHAETEYVIIKSVDLQSRQDMQQYKEQVISLERDLRKSKQTEKDMYKELDEVLKDLEDVSNRYQAVQKENTELKRGQQMPVSQMDDSQLVQELNFKNRQMEILHAEIKKYADNFDTERKKVAMLSAENQRYQHQIQHIQNQALLSPHSPNFPSIRTQPQPFGNVHNQWEGMQSPSPTVLSRDTASNQPLPNHSATESNYHLSEPCRQANAGRRGAYPFNMPKTYPPDRTRTTPRFDEPYTGQPVEPCPLCGKTFSTTELLMAHAASCL